MGLDDLNQFEVGHDLQQQSVAPSCTKIEDIVSENSAVRVLKWCLKEEQNEDENLSVDKQLMIRRLIKKPFCRCEMINELKTLTTAEAAGCFRMLITFLQNTIVSSNADDEFSNFEQLIDFISMLIDAHSFNMWKDDIFRDDVLHLNNVCLCTVCYSNGDFITMPALSLIILLVGVVQHVITSSGTELIDTQFCGPAKVGASVAFSKTQHNYAPSISPKNEELIKNVSTFDACLSSCCYNVNCSAIFYAEETLPACYNIECTVKEKDKCRPVHVEENRNTSFLLLRNVTKENSISRTYGRPCDEGSNVKCEENQICVRPTSLNDRQLVCACSTGYIFKDDKCVLLAPDSSSANVNFSPKACTYGLDECSLETKEECKLEDGREHSKRGKCVCINGYVRNERGLCKINMQDISVTISGNSSVHLPVEEVALVANVSSTNENFTFDDMKYDWNIVSSPVTAIGGKEGNADGRASKTLHLMQLEVGNYVITLTVLSKDISATANFNLTILPQIVPNKPPKATIVPDHIDAMEHTKIILDGSSSKDENPGQIVDWTWQYVDGPINNEFNSLPKQKTLEFEKLKPGNYTFKLTVKDNDGAEDSALATVSISEEVDYPPKANAGSCDSKVSGDIQVRLPVKAIFICGNSSTDDKRIVKWKWSMKDTTKNTADMEGTGTPVLTVSNIQVGDYTFTLEVEDEKDQKASADVRVVVLPAVNDPPVAKAGLNVTVTYPENSAILDGGLSSDDGHIATYRWNQTSGPTKAKLTNDDKVKMTAGDLVKGVYWFRLNVTDDFGLSSVDDVFVKVDESSNSPPVAKALNSTVTLPATVAYLNGSLSSDDAGIVKWHWSLLDDSPAGLVFLGNTRDQSILMVSNLNSPGKYYFNLSVYDKQSSCSSTITILDVLSGDKEKETVEIYLNTKLKDFTMKHKRKFVKQLGAFLATNKDWDEVGVVITGINEDPTNGKTRLLLYCYTKSNELITSKDVVNFLDVHLSESDMLLDFNIDKFDTKYCRNLCSGHGVCDDYTKQCSCERYWMPNFFKSRYPRHSNCDWSVLYFVLVIVFLTSVVIGSVIATMCSCSKSRSCVRRAINGSRPRKYRTLNDAQMNKYGHSLKNLRGKNGYAHFADSDSESLLSSEEETVYDRSSLLKPKSVSNGVEA